MEQQNAVELAEQQGEIDISALVERMDENTEVLKDVRATLQALLDSVFIDKAPPPEKRKAVIVSNGDSALRARVGLAASCRDWKYKAWVDAFGMREFHDLTPDQKKRVKRDA